MTKTKKVVAIMLALLMMFSSFSVLATAWDATTDDGSALTIATKFFKEVDGEWVETTKVRPNDVVKARVYLGTDYYSNDSTLLFFYDKDFFTLGSTGALAVNSSDFATANGITASYNANPNVNSQVAKGYIDAAFLNDYSAVTANVHTENPANDGNIMYDNSDWLLEFTMTVNADASGEGDFFVKDTTVQSTTNDRGIVNVPKGPADGNDMDIWAMWLWDADVALSSQPVTTISSVTFNANGGAYNDGTDSKVIEGEIDAEIATDSVPVLVLEGYTFMGWVDATDAEPTLDEAAPAPTAIPENDLVLNAFWLKNVNITFNTDGGSDIAPIQNVTPYTDFADVEAPTKSGYTFVGWDVRGGNLPKEYPDVDTTYTAIWALNVVVSFDTLGGTEIADVEGYEGDDFEAVIPNPTKEGHRFVKWDKELPTVFPEQDTTYTAIFETLTYVVTYIIEGEEPYEIELEYGAEIPTSLILAELPEGTEIKNWYTDSGYSNALAEGAKMGAAPMTLYAKAEGKTYNAIFMVDGEEYEVVPTAYGEFIQTPADPSKVGYEFAGWEPYPFEMEAQDMVFNASWVESEVNLKYWLDDSQSSESVWYDGTIAYGEEIDVPADPYKEGYDFLGWSETPDGEVINLHGMTMPAEALEFYAIFDVQKHKIIFNTDGGTEIETIRGDFGSAVTAPAAPTKTGYTFAGWIDESGAPTEVPATMPAEDITLKATWTINQYTITFDTDGGSEVAPITQDYATDVTAPAAPTKTGYTFAGWDTEVPATMPAKDMTITAQWTVNQYTITFDPDGGSDVAPITQDYNTAVTAPAAPTKTGYTFAGWTPEVPATMPAEDVTLTAQWTINQYTITFDTDGGSAVDPITQDYNTAVTAPAAPTKTGYTFAGWDVEVPATMPAKDMTITAQWTINQYTITFDTDGGSAVAPITQDYNTAVTAPAAPTKTGYTFAGWDVEVPATMPAKDMTITAQWTVNQYTITFNSNGGSEVAPITQDYNTAVTAPAAPTKTGYSFTGWTPEVPATMPAENITVNAAWEAITYKATFDADGGAFADGTTENKVLDATYDAEFTAPTGLTKTGYEFSHWTPEVPSTWNIAGDQTFKAVWVASDETKYTVITKTMNVNGEYEESSKTYTGTTGEPVNVKPESVAEGFKLNDADSVYEGVIAADSSLELIVVIDREIYTFTSIADNGTDPSATDYRYGQTVVKPADPEKTGYVFAGWDGEIPATMPAHDVTVTAKWDSATDTAVTVNVNYTDVKDNTDVQLVVSDVYTATTDKAVEIVTAMPETPVEGTTYILVSTVIADAEMYAGGDPEVLKHYEFDADNAANVLKETVAADGSTTLTINLKPVKYTATFLNADGSTFATVDMDYYSLVADNLPAGEPTKEGHTFTGWENADKIHLAKDQDIKPVFAVNQYTITFNTDGGSDVAPITQDYGTAVTAPAAPTKTGYTFAGWDTEVPATMPAEDMTITAQWTINQYTITFDTDGGTAVDPITQDYNTAVTAPAAPTKTGYTFAGWDTEVPATMPAKDMTITAQWTVNQYTITFDVDGGTAVAPITQDYGTAVTAPAAPTKTGYTFAGWDTEVPATMPAKDMTITAQWTINQYTITFDTDGGTAVAPITQDYNTAVTAPAAPTKTGYTFAGWDTEVPATMPAKDMTITAQWTVNQYTITFDTDGGSDVAPITQDYATAVTAPAAPTKTGYTFAGWDTEVPATMPAEDMTITAQWTINQYTITFDTDGGTAVAPITQDYNTAVTAPAAPTKTGYTFAGWDTEVPATMPAKDMTITAQWTVNQYTITFDTDGGSAVDPITQDYNTAVTAPAAPTKTGYTFAGWDVAVPSTMPAEDMTITAKWTINQYTITFNSNGGSEVAPITQDYNTAVTAPAAPTKTGYSFTGWTPEVPATMPAENITVNATWEAITYKATFDADGGAFADGTTENKVLDATYDAGFTAPTGLTKTGYEFSHWTPEVPSTWNIAGDQTFTAVWVASDATKYTVITHTMNANGEYEESSKTYEGTTGEPVNVKPADADIAEGFKLNDEKSEYEGTIAADSSLVLHVYIDRETYQFTTIVDGNKTSTDYLYGAAIATPADPVKEGHSFVQWSPAIPATMPVGGIEVTARFNKLSYDFVVDTDGGLIYNPNEMADVESYTVSVKYGEAISAPAEEPTKTGYTFAGWSEIPATMPAEKVTITAQWTINQYTITFNTDGGSAVDPITQDYATAVTAPAAPTKTGYTFAGWDKEIPATMPAEDMTITAQWTVNQYTITFNTDGGSAVAPITQDYNTAVTAPAAPTKTGYTFAGWDTEIPATMPAKDMTITAQWTINQYTITFDTDGGSDVAPITQDYATAVTAPAAPTKTGYTFAGWDTEVPATMPAEDVTITAQWTVNQYTITFNVDGGSAVAPITQDYNTAVTAPAAPTKTGYTFAGWDTEVPATMPAKDMTITAQWTINQYTITFDTDDGSDVAPITQDYATAVTAPAAPTKTGYTFAGWDTEVPATMPAEDMTITAQWTINQYTITFDTDGGSAVAPITQDYATAVTAPAAPTKTGYTFAGWDVEVPATMPAKDMTITAQWTINQYTITFDTDGGSEVAPITQDYNTAVTAPAAPTKTGYTFAGWDTEIPATMPAEDVTITAQWTINQYTITFNTDGGSAVDPITQDYNTAVTAPAAPTKTGYTFAGWDKEIPATMPAEDMTITAQWTANQYTITFDVDGGSAVAPITQDFGTAVTAPAAPTKAGYSFAGWSPELPATMPAENITVKAQWTALDGVAYTVEIYKMNTDGTYEGVAPEILNKADKAGETVSYSPETITGFTFDAAQNNVLEGVVAGDGSLVLKAYYSRNKVNVTINGKEEEYFYGEQITTPETPKAEEGYEFDKWVDENGDEVEFPFTVPAEDTVITPVYNPLKYMTTWTADGAKVDSFEVTFGEAIAAPEAPAKTGYRFVKWSPDVPATMPAKDMEFTAIYEVMTGYIVEYYVEGKLVESFSYMYGDSFVAYDYEAPTGYDFDGWYADADCSTEFEAPATVTAEMTKIYGKLAAKTYNATFNANGGKFADGETTVDVPTVFDEQIVAPAAPTREGYVFAGWDNEVGLMDEEGKTFNASWVADSSLTATYIVDGDEENPYAVYEVAYGEDLDVPADPYKEGWEFLGWSETIDGEVITLPAKMPATSVKYYAIFEQSVAELVVYEYAESEHGPAATPAPELVAMEDFSGMVLIGSTVALPAAEEMAIENYIFTGWVDNEGNVYAADAEITMPATKLELIPTYERVQIKLIPVAGSTAVIERNGVTESYNDNTVTEDPYETPANFNQYYIYGFTNKRQLPTEGNLESRYITYTGDGRIEITRREGMEDAAKLGTGTVVTLYDNVTGEVVEQFYLIYFGDVDGDCYVTAADANNVNSELSIGRTWSALRGSNRVLYMIKAANLDGQTNIYTADLNLLNDVVSATATIDQKTGLAS